MKSGVLVHSEGEFGIVATAGLGWLAHRPDKQKLHELGALGFLPSSYMPAILQCNAETPKNPMSHWEFQNYGLTEVLRLWFCLEQREGGNAAEACLHRMQAIACDMTVTRMRMTSFQ